MNNPSELRLRLMSREEEVRREAVMALRHQAEREVLSLLYQALGDESWRVRKAAVAVFREFPLRREAIAYLIKALGDSENAGLRTAAVEALSQIGKEAVPQLIETLSHPDPDVRKFGIDILGEIRDERSVEAILPLLRDKVEVIRLAAVEALGAIGGDRAFEILLQLLNEEDVSLLFGVLHALGRIGRPIPFAAIKKLLPNRLLRRALFDALGQTRSPEAVVFIVEGLSDPAKSSRQAAVRALHQLASEPGMRETAKAEVQKRLAGASLEPFREILESSHLPTKRTAVTLLSLLGTVEAAELLLRAASDDSIQPEVAEALARMRKEAPDPVTQALKAEGAEEEDKIEILSAPRETTAQIIGPMTMEQFHRVRDLVARESGLFYDRELKYLVERRVQRRMEELKVFDYEEYFHLLEGAPPANGIERQKLISLLCTNETYFFREEFQLRAFTEEILPGLKKKKEREKNRRLRIWSAGCSSGEEPYTIAILVRETPGLENFQVEIIGSDISEAMIEKAREGLYTEASFRTTPSLYLNKYFVPEGNRRRLQEDIRKMVSFDTTNLLACGRAPHLQDLDIIFCRNVIIYFNPEAKLKVVEQFYQLLVPGGYLLLGHSESLMNVSSSFELVHLQHDLVYRKPEGKK